MLLNRFLPRIEFDNYEDFKENYKVNVPENVMILLMNGLNRNRKN